jgi:flavodoxin
MGKKCLIIYSSYTGNTEKVALRFKGTFERQGWECDILKIGKKAEDILHPHFDMNNYDFVCVGSGLRVHLPYNEILNLLRRLRLGIDPRIALKNRDETISYIKEPLPAPPPPEEMVAHHRKIVLGPDSRKAVIFVTYAGYEFGPKEAEPAMQLLDLEIEHIGFKCIGHFCCPGKFLDNPTLVTYHGDIRDRPNEKDLLKAEMFVEERLEEIADRTAT